MVSLNKKIKGLSKDASDNRKPAKGMDPPTNLIRSVTNNFNNGLLQKTLSDVSKLLCHYPSSATLYNIQGAANARLHNPDAALESFKKAISINPRSAEVNNNMGNILKEQGQLEKAVKAFKNAFLLKPDFAEAFYNLGNAYKEMRKLTDAISAYNKALLLNPNYAEALYNKGLAQSDMDDLDAAIDSYNQAIRINPKFGSAFNNLGSALFEKGEIEKAIESYKQAVKFSPNDADAWNNLGSVSSIIGNHQAAIESFNQALKINPSYVVALFKLGQNLKFVGEANEAATCFETVANLDENDVLGAKLQLATLGRSSTPSKTPKGFMENFYKERAEIWDSQPLEKYSGHLLIASAFGQVNIGKNNVILDLGCGTGSLASFLKPYAKSLIGIDLSHEMLNYAEKTGLYDILLEKDIEFYMAETSDQYDVVVAAAVFIHFLNLDRLFKLIANSLKKNGQFIFTVFEGQKADKYLNEFLLYSHSDNYVSGLAKCLGLKIVFRDRAIHEYHEKTPIYCLVYVLQKLL